MFFFSTFMIIYSKVTLFRQQKGPVFDSILQMVSLISNSSVHFLEKTLLWNCYEYKKVASACFGIRLYGSWTHRPVISLSIFEHRTRLHTSRQREVLSALHQSDQHIKTDRSTQNIQEAVTVLSMRQSSSGTI